MLIAGLVILCVVFLALAREEIPSRAAKMTDHIKQMAVVYLAFALGVAAIVGAVFMYRNTSPSPLMAKAYKARAARYPRSKTRANQKSFHETETVPGGSIDYRRSISYS